MSEAIDPVVRSSARWFWWIAGFSLVNVVMLYSGSDTNFVIGLAMTVIAAIIFKGALPIAVVLVGLTVGFYVAMGYFAQQRKLWAFYLGLALYAIDAAIYMYLGDWMSVAFHGLAGYFIFKGIVRVKQLASQPNPAPQPAP